MKNQYGLRTMITLLGGLTLFFAAQSEVVAQRVLIDPDSEVIDPGAPAHNSDFVTINVKNANISEVLKAYSLQTGQSIVVGPDVVSENVNVRLNNIPWQDALDVILKPYGFGYRVVGDTIVISELASMVTVEGIEPLVSKLFTLKYVDAYDIKDICEAQLSERGKCTILTTKSMPGWEFGGDASKGTSGAAVEGGVRKQREREDILKSKKIVVTDVPSAITRIEKIISEIDALPRQVLIEARFMEITSGKLSDIGLDYIGALEKVKENSSGSSSSSSSALVNESLLNVLNLTTGFPDPLNTGATGSFSQDSGIRLTQSFLGDWGAELLIALMSQNDNVNVLSAPSILSVDNQEAAILVGKKYPIIESSTSGDSSTRTSTSLDYYENIGIQLNVIPQVCADGYVNMIVHPAVSEIESFESGVVTAGSDTLSGTQYPVLNVREAETQIMIQSANTAIIGGLQNERNKTVIKKFPFLGDLPLLGRLFRRETITREKVDLLIFIKATIVDNEIYQSDSTVSFERRTKAMEVSVDAEGTTTPVPDKAAVRELLDTLKD
ncbi:MAG: secretin and TonB N-terminal domain-containing protein [Pontiellaceae bacterium]|nr:secretin and TonB N-terminal domain-containing protein [Pontiellaceae bacterium]MBN2783573.1 secretin and TonB N-terminal domain-containing protein [Pontiellaceae bacterium]